MNPTDMAIRKLEQLMARDPLLQDVFAKSLPRQRTPGRFTPEADVLELDDAWVLLLDVPGVDRETIDVQLRGERLSVRGARGLGHPEDADLRVAERRGGRFQREFLLPAGVDNDSVTARLREGVLEIRIPLKGTSGPRKVVVD